MTKWDLTKLAVLLTWIRPKWIRLTWTFDISGHSTKVDSAEVDSTYLDVRHNWLRLKWSFDLLGSAELDSTELYSTQLGSTARNQEKPNFLQCI